MINEVMWMGSSKSSKDEWVELRNNTDQKIQLKGWQIDNLLRSNGTFVFPDEPTIEIDRKSFFLVSYYSKVDGIVDGVSVLDNKGLIWRCNEHPSCASFSLANSNNGDLALRDDTGREIDRVLGEPWPAGKKKDDIGYSMERINPLSDGSDPDNWATAIETKNLIFGVSDKATPESENSVFSSSPTLVPTPMPSNTPTQASTYYPSDIYISEFMANPETGDDEWVEIYNANSTEVFLVDWYIDDKKDEGASPKKFSATISANSYYVISFSSGTLNNDGDDVRLLNPDNEGIDSKSYSSTIKGKSWSKDDDGDWCQIDPTKEESNSSCPSSDSSSATPIPTSSPAPTIKVTPTPTVTATPTPSEEPTPTEEEQGVVLGVVEATEAGEESGPIWPRFLIGLGGLLMAGASYPLWLPQIKKLRYNRRHGKTKEIL